MKELRATLREVVEPPWSSLEPIVVGDVSSGRGTPAVYALVQDENGTPVLRIDVHEREPAPHPFHDAIAWSGFIVIGFGDRVHLVSTSSRTATTTKLDGYFGHLYGLPEQLLVAGATRLSCFDRRGSILWRSERLGIDGVIVNDVVDGVIDGSGEWDPPGGWQPFRISLAAGSAI